jgi:serine/threonine protein kinase
LADFGLARNFSKNQQLTPRVVTLWYRPPEILLGDERYSTSIDIWAVGCIFGELLLKEPLMPGKSDMHQLQLIFDLIGYPSDKIWPDFYQLPLASKIKIPMESYSNIQPKFKDICDPVGLDLLEKMLCYDPKKRITASEALKHEYFKCKPYPKDILFMPTFKSTNQF